MNNMKAKEIHCYGELWRVEADYKYLGGWTMLPREGKTIKYYNLDFIIVPSEEELVDAIHTMMEAQNPFYIFENIKVSLIDLEKMTSTKITKINN